MKEQKKQKENIEINQKGNYKLSISVGTEERKRKYKNKSKR